MDIAHITWDLWADYFNGGNEKDSVILALIAKQIDDFAKGVEPSEPRCTCNPLRLCEIVNNKIICTHCGLEK